MLSPVARRSSMTLHLKSRGYPFRPRLLFSSFIVVGVAFPTVYYFRRGQTIYSHGFGSGLQAVFAGKRKEEWWSVSTSKAV